MASRLALLAIPATLGLLFSAPIVIPAVLTDGEAPASAPVVTTTGDSGCAMFCNEVPACTLFCDDPTDEPVCAVFCNEPEPASLCTIFCDTKEVG
ncbi:hypothetical protein [Nocardia asteroides]|uniref:hypothetical protein n=1 Tax=Nocardia asteroides TaxID=1824 RepID=UPI003660ED2A